MKEFMELNMNKNYRKNHFEKSDFFVVENIKLYIFFANNILLVLFYLGKCSELYKHKFEIKFLLTDLNANFQIG